VDSLPNIKTSFPEWYQEIIMQAGLVDTSPTRGCFIIKPYGFAIWENIQRIVDAKIKQEGVENVYFPMLIPEEFLRREEKHIEGFAPEVAVVTHAGGKKLEEPYVIRPTSETVVYEAFSRWIKSWRDLPLKINQWANVVRWEMRTRAFLRTTEFLWQEGHTAHATYEEAKAMSLAMLEHYRQLAEDYLAIPVVIGEKTAHERFPGADTTYTFEALMQDGKALQMGTSHILSQSFPAAFGVKFQAQDGTLQSPFCTSWGSTTRLIGALVMTHGDQNGLIIPPKIAPTQIVIVPIYKTPEEKISVIEAAMAVAKELRAGGIRVVLDMDETKTPGAKFYYWESRGVPVRLELGPKDLLAQQAVLVNRMEEDKTKKKTFIKLSTVVEETTTLLSIIQKALFDRAAARRASQWKQADKLSEFASLLDANNCMYQVGWCGSEACELTLKEVKGTIRCLVNENKHKTCFNCTSKSNRDILVAKCY
jgi:prolyl-tRNA synthetase